MDDIKNMKKIELHIHLDGSMDPSLASKLSNLPLDYVKDKMIVKKDCQNLSEYLEKFTLPISLMQTKENLELVSKDLVNRLAKDNVIYAEIRFAPMFHTTNLTYEEVVEAVLKGLKSNKNIKTNLILCLMRGMDNKSNQKTLEVAYKYLNKGVCALDLAGDEGNYPLDNYEDFFKQAKKLGIPFTIHAGEVKIEEVKKAIKLGTKRIGHGIHAIEDNEVVNLIKENNILLEVCPTSNIQTKAFNDYKEHPIYKFYKEGVLVSINTDNETVSDIDLTYEYQKLIEIFSFTKDDLKNMNINALKHSFLDKESINNLLTVLTEE